MAAPHNSVRAFGEGFFVEARFEKCRNTLCISNFSNRWTGEKCPAKDEGELCGVAQSQHRTGYHAPEPCGADPTHNPIPRPFLEALYNANYERLYIYAENLLFNAAYAEEAVQETFFEAVRKQDALMRHAKPEAWLMETLKNKTRVGSRRRALEALYFISLEQDLAQESKKLAVEDRPFGSINELLDAIRALLPPEDYRLLCRITLEGATHLEVAKELGISVWSSQKRLQRIRKKLCKQLLPNKSKKISENMSVLRF